MIEIKKKFLLTDAQRKKLLENAEFLGEKTFTDVYYDTPEYALTKNDIWLRTRNGRFEVKLPLQKNRHGLANQYHEIEGEEKIRQIFDIIPRGSFLEDIQSFGYASFGEFSTIRREYKRGKFTIDLDEVDYGNFKYSVAEIELLVEIAEEIKKANDEILAFADLMGLNPPVGGKNLRGKMSEYLFRQKPDQYKALIDAGVMIE